MKIKIADKYIGKGEPVFIIAEAGVNHNGKIDLAKKLIEKAKKAGADAIKFQTFKAERLNTKKAPKAQYHIKTTGNKQSWYDLLKTQELNEKEHKIISDYCKKNNIIFLSTPYDTDSVDLLNKLGVPAFKIASCDINNTPLLKYIAKKKKPIILSTGMSTIKEIEEAVKTIKKEGNKNIILLQCTANYPAKPENSNLRVINTLKNEFDLPVGYSDHTLNQLTAIASIAAGAMVYEAHLTINKNLPGPDHRSSFKPEEFKKVIDAIRKTEIILGSSVKIITKEEKENRKKLRRSVVANCNIKKGSIIKKDMIAIKRPATGLEPKFFYKIVGKRAKVDIPKDTLIKMKQVK